MMNDTLIVRTFGLTEYHTSWKAMQAFTKERQKETPDEIWLLEHPPVFTQGQNGKPEHILHPGDIPVIPVDRGGQVTYHGPGQLVAYVLMDLARKKWNIRQLVTYLEQSVIQLLAEYDVTAHAKCKAPGVYIEDKKICSIGLRIRRGCSFHGLALNVSTHLEPFTRINPCGFPHLKMTTLATETKNKVATVLETGIKLSHYLTMNLETPLPNGRGSDHRG